MSGNTRIGWVNALQAAGVAFAATSAAPQLPASNVATDQGSPSTAWQTAAGVTTATLTISSLPATAIAAIAVCRANLTAAASVVFTLKASGATVFTATKAGPVAGYGQIIVPVTPAISTADTLTIAITDAGNPDTFLNVPLVFVGAMWTPSKAMSWPTTFGRDDKVNEVVSYGGQEYPGLLYQRRLRNCALDNVLAAEVWPQIAELDRVSRIGGNVLLIPDVTSPTIAQEAILGRVKSAADMSFPLKTTAIMSWRFTSTERL